MKKLTSNLRATGRRLRDDETGAIAILAAASLTLVVASAALAVDTGRIALMSRDLQKVVDLAALDGAQVFGNRFEELCGNERTRECVERETTRIVLESVDRNPGWSHAAAVNNVRTIDVVFGEGELFSDGSVVFEPGADGALDAISAFSVTAVADIQQVFIPGVRTVTRDASVQTRALCQTAGTNVDPRYCSIGEIQVGSALASFDGASAEEATIRNKFLNESLGAMLGASPIPDGLGFDTSLDFVGYGGIMDAEIELKYLAAAYCETIPGLGSLTSTIPNSPSGLPLSEPTPICDTLPEDVDADADVSLADLQRVLSTKVSAVQLANAAASALGAQGDFAAADVQALSYEIDRRVPLSADSAAIWGEAIQRKNESGEVITGSGQTVYDAVSGVYGQIPSGPAFPSFPGAPDQPGIANPNEFVTASTGAGSAFAGAITFGDLLLGYAQVVNGENVLDYATTLDLNGSNVPARIEVQTRIIEPAQTAIGPPSPFTIAKTAQGVVKATVTVGGGTLNGVALPSIILPIYAEVAGAQASLNTAACPSFNDAQDFSAVPAQVNASRVSLGSPSFPGYGLDLTDDAEIILTTVSTVTEVIESADPTGLVGATVPTVSEVTSSFGFDLSGEVTIGGTTSDMKNFPDRTYFGAAKGQTIGASGLPITSTLLASPTVRLNGVTVDLATLESTLAAAFSTANTALAAAGAAPVTPPTIQSIFGQINDTVGPLVNSLGLTIGQAKVATLDIDCGIKTLISR